MVTPAYPGFEVEAEALRADTTPIATVTVSETIARLEKVITALPEKPIIMGHSFGSRRRAAGCGSHWTCGEPGWEQVADKALDWALTHDR